MNKLMFNIPTRIGNQFPHNAQDRMIIRNPTARTNESRITAVELGSERFITTVSNILFIPACVILPVGVVEGMMVVNEDKSRCYSG